MTDRKEFIDLISCLSMVDINFSYCQKCGHIPDCHENGVCMVDLVEYNLLRCPCNNLDERIIKDGQELIDAYHIAAARHSEFQEKFKNSNNTLVGESFKKAVILSEIEACLKREVNKC